MLPLRRKTAAGALHGHCDSSYPQNRLILMACGLAIAASRRTSRPAPHLRPVDQSVAPRRTDRQPIGEILLPICCRWHSHASRNQFYKVGGQNVKDDQSTKRYPQLDLSPYRRRPVSTANLGPGRSLSSGRAKRGPVGRDDNHSSYGATSLNRSTQCGLSCSIKLNIHSGFHSLICFSRRIATSTEVCASNQTLKPAIMN